MTTLTMIEHVGCEEKYLAVFLDDSLQEMISVGSSKKDLSAIKQKHIADFKTKYPEGSVAVLECAPYFQEFQSLSDFPSSLKSYFKA